MGVVVITDSTLDAGSLTTANVSLKAGGVNAVAGSVVYGTDTKGFKFVPAAKLNYGQTYTFSATVKDTLGRQVQVNSSITTTLVTCIAPQVADSTGTKCVTPPPVVLHYTDKVYALWKYGLPFVVTKTGVTKVVNKTSFPVPSGYNYSLNGCELADKPLANGWILTRCWDGATVTLQTFYIDPNKDEMYDYTGTVPADTVWHRVASIDPVTPTWGAKAKVADGWYFTAFDNSWVLKFQADATGAVTVIKEGTFAADGNLLLLMTYNN